MSSQIRRAVYLWLLCEAFLGRASSIAQKMLHFYPTIMVLWSLRKDAAAEFTSTLSRRRRSPASPRKHRREYQSVPIDNFCAR